MSDSRKKWVSSREAFDTSARLLHKMYPDMSTYKAQVQVLDENLQLRAEVAKYKAVAGAARKAAKFLENMCEPGFKSFPAGRRIWCDEQKEIEDALAELDVKEEGT